MAACGLMLGCVMGVEAPEMGADFGTGDLLGGTGRPGSDGGFVGDARVVARDAMPNPMPCRPEIEKCNGQDDDCDGAVDEVFSLGEMCTVTIDECPIVGRIACNPQDVTQSLCQTPPDAMPGDEVCNGVDDDCDGDVDEGLPADCLACMPADEVCNQSDDDCDGAVDEDAQPANTPELCNGIDDDCDGVVDEEVNAGQLEELCNGLDDDCDGNIDEGEACPCQAETFEGTRYLFCGRANVATVAAFAVKVPWQEARSLCQRVGGDLVTVDSEPLDVWLFQQADQRGFDETWFGMNDIQNEGQWVWLDGEMMPFTDWDSGEPNDGGNGEDCGIMHIQSRRGRWDDRPCGRNYHYICEL